MDMPEVPDAVVMKSPVVGGPGYKDHTMQSIFTTDPNNPSNQHDE